MLLHIKERYLTAIEEDRFDDLPSAVQGRGFIRLYWDYLGLPAGELELLLLPPATPTERIIPVENQDQSIVESTPAAADEIEKQEEIVEPPGPQPEVKLTSSEVYKEIGENLRKQRSRLSLSVANIEEITHIPYHYIQALEAGKFDELPSPVQGKGMLSNYADFLNLDTDRVLLKYAEALQLKREEAQVLVEKKGKKISLSSTEAGRDAQVRVSRQPEVSFPWISLLSSCLRSLHLEA